MITADQLVIHAIGDYVLQSDWMAQEKTRKSLAAFIHAFTYSLPFLLLSQSWKALTVILVTHFIIDRWRLARYVCWVKNFLAPPTSTETIYTEAATSAGGVPLFTENVRYHKWWYSWTDCDDTGYHRERPPWMRVWLMIIADNIMHVVINGLALTYL